MSKSQGNRVFLEIPFRQEKYNCFGWVLVEVKTHSVPSSYYKDSEHFNDCISTIRISGLPKIYEVG